MKMYKWRIYICLMMRGFRVTEKGIGERGRTRRMIRTMIKGRMGEVILREGREMKLVITVKNLMICSSTLVMGLVRKVVRV